MILLNAFIKDHVCQQFPRLNSYIGTISRLEILQWKRSFNNIPILFRSRSMNARKLQPWPTRCTKNASTNSKELTPARNVYVPSNRSATIWQVIQLRLRPSITNGGMSTDIRGAREKRDARRRLSTISESAVNENQRKKSGTREWNSERTNWGKQLAKKTATRNIK